MALLEAMASGLPVVCSDIRGSRDLMEEIAPTAEQPQAQDKTASTSDLLQCKGGYMIKKADNVDAYAQALALILKNPEDMNTMGQTNALRAQQFSMQQVAARMEEIYKRISSR